MSNNNKEIVLQLAKKLNVRNPYQELVTQSKTNSNYRSLSGNEFIVLSHRFIERVRSEYKKLKKENLKY